MRWRTMFKAITGFGRASLRYSLPERDDDRAEANDMQRRDAMTMRADELDARLRVLSLETDLMLGALSARSRQRY